MPQSSTLTKVAGHDSHDQYLARHRWHDPELGRWARRDPLGPLDSNSLYEYVRSNPLARFDPHGLFSQGGNPLAIPAEKDAIEPVTGSIEWEFKAEIVFEEPASSGYGLKCAFEPSSPKPTPETCEPTKCDFDSVKIRCKLTYNGQAPVTGPPADDWHSKPGVPSELGFPKGRNKPKYGKNKVSLRGGNGQKAESTIMANCYYCFNGEWQ